MKERGLVVVLAFLLAIGATAAVFLYVNGVKSDATNGGTTSQVIVSKQIIPSGTNLDGLVSSGAFVTKAVPTEDLVPGAVTSIQQLQGKTTSQTIVGRTWHNVVGRYLGNGVAVTQVGAANTGSASVTTARPAASATACRSLTLRSRSRRPRPSSLSPRTWRRSTRSCR